MTRAITATYRLQLRREFPLTAARALVPYLSRLGVSHVYLSPVLAARPGSPHGYDVIDHARMNPELGTEDDLRALAEALHARDMGIVLDIVPNHMAASESNRYWDDVLARGRSSRFAGWFDIDWEAPHAAGKVVLPVLADELDLVLERGEVKPRIRDSGARLEYRGRTFPLDPATLPREFQLAQLDPAGRAEVDAWASGDSGQARLRKLLAAQHYTLAFWRDAGEINYRRFFDVNDLVALCMDSEALFLETHRLVLAWVRDGVVDALRLDHVDGLARPTWYLAQLRAALAAARPDHVSVFVEKILTGDEALPARWPVDGTTGYDFMNAVEELFIDPAGLVAIEAYYRALRKSPSLNFRTIAEDAKRRALTGSLCPDVRRVARLAASWRRVPEADFAAAIVEFLVHLDVYRTYVSEPGTVDDADRHALTDALQAARARETISRAALDALEGAFFAAPDPTDNVREELVVRLQQLSAPATAKGVEDTALYVYMPLASRNEVGGAPHRPLTGAQTRVHDRNAARARHWPRTMLATNTHDTKRSADLRARLDVLTEEPEQWSRHATRWRRLNKPRKRIVRGKPAPDTNSEYLYYQMLLGLWPAPRPDRRADDLPDRDWIERLSERLVTYMLKAAREAKTRTSWTDADSQYEKALEAFVRETLQPEPDTHFLPDVARLTALVADRGFRVSLARVLLHCTAPGTPDIYQGDEIWNFTLVDPDNRRPVDYPLLERLISEAESPTFLREAFESGQNLFDGKVKLALLSRLLRFRRDHSRLMAEGDYFPLATGDLFAFARRRNEEMCICVARTRLTPQSQTEQGPHTIVLPLELAGAWRSVLTERAITFARGGAEATGTAADLITPNAPCELLYKTSR
jgi:(1->4)-alpha-D-glucan 1-alpha-D-glucosylmutase